MVTTLPRRIWKWDGFVPLLITSAFIPISLVLHHQLGSMTTWTNETWQEAIRGHMTYHPFAIRPLTTSTVRIIHWLTGLSFKHSFLLTQYGLLMAIGPVFCWYLQALGISRRYALVGLILLVTAYPVLCAFLEPVYTWDDFWLYLLIPISFALALRQHSILAMLAMMAASLARETGILFYPWFVILLAGNYDVRRRSFWVLAVLPAIAFVSYQLAVYAPPESTQFRMLLYNFQDSAYTRNSLYSLAVSFGFLWVTLALSLMLINKRRWNRKIHRFPVAGAVIQIPLFVALVIVTARARETRLFFPPFVFVIPLSLALVEQYQNYWLKYVRYGKAVPAVIATIAALLLGQWAAKELFPTLDFRPPVWFAQVWFGVQLAIAALILVPAIGGLFSRSNDNVAAE